MNILAIKGFSSLGRLEKFFEPPEKYYTPAHPPINRLFFPIKFNWRQKDEMKVRRAYRHYCGNEPFIALGYSDAGSFIHRLAHHCQNCIGLIAVNCTFNPPSTESIRQIPTLLLYNQEDRTPTKQSTLDAIVYNALVLDADKLQFEELYNLPDDRTFLNHNFDVAIEPIQCWMMQHFETPAPFRKPPYTYNPKDSSPRYISRTV